MISPTGKGVRNDPMGRGTFGAPRGARKHNGVDYLCAPGQEVYAPISGTVEREARPYGDEYSGCVIRGTNCTVTLFYLLPVKVGLTVSEGDIIGRAQDISLKYGKEMKPHIHMEVSMDPETLMNSCLTSQHHIRNGCQSLLGLVIALDDGLEKLAVMGAVVKYTDTLKEMSWQIEQVKAQSLRIGEAARRCGK